VAANKVWNTTSGQPSLANHYSQHERGFTLIEILVVIFLVGIMVSVVVLSIGGNNEKDLRNEILRLKQVMLMAQEEAVLSQQQLAILFSPHGYEFNILRSVVQETQPENNDPAIQGAFFSTEENIWQEVDQPKHLLPHEVREEYKFKLLQEGISVALDEEENEGRRIILASSGEMTAFELYLRYPDEDLSFHLIGSPMGDLFIEELEELDPNLDPQY
jgi:general secretion pathway protein H